MRIYEGSPRQHFEDVLRALGAHLDERGSKEILVLELPDGFVVQALSVGSAGRWSAELGRRTKETLVFTDDELAELTDSAHARRGARSDAPSDGGGYYGNALRVLGHFVDGEAARDLFLFEQDGAFVLRLLKATGTGDAHVLAEFTRDDIEALIAAGPKLRGLGSERSA